MVTVVYELLTNGQMQVLSSTISTQNPDQEPTNRQNTDSRTKYLNQRV